MNKEWQEQMESKRQGLIKEFQRMNDNPLDEIYPQKNISRLREEKNKWYNKAQELNKALERQDKVIDGYRKKNETLERYLDRINTALEKGELSEAEDVLYTWRGYE